MRFSFPVYNSLFLLIVSIGADENGNVISGDGEDETSGEREKGLDDLSEMMPRIVNMSRPRTGGNTFRQHAGSNLSLFCSVDGQPMPLVSWVKLKVSYLFFTQVYFL